MKSILFCVLLFGPIIASAQTDSDTLAIDNVRIPLPTLDINVGVGFGFTDVKLSSNGPTPFRQLGYQLTINQQIGKFLNAGFQLYTGSVYGEEQRGNININFRTSLVSPRIGIEYNFYPLIKPRANGRQLFRPYLGFGLGAVFFRSKGDLKDENNISYQYWSNGRIYAEAEGSVAESEATQLTRDFEYETDLRDENIDGLRKYSQTAFSMPINAGVRIQISKTVGVNLGFSYALNFTDLIDNVNTESVGIRQGTANFDNHLFGSLGLSVFLGSTKPSAKPAKFTQPVLATKPKELSDSTKSVATTEGTEGWDELAAVSAELIAAAETMSTTSSSSADALGEKQDELKSISEGKLSTKKELKTAKNKSLEILDSSIVLLKNTNSQLTEATGKVDLISNDLKKSGLDEQLNQTEKLQFTIDESIPAIESLKSKIQSAKTVEELKSILNISAKNLSHTNDIFTEEAESLTSSILDARKSVAVARTEKLVFQGISSKTEIEALKSELEELKNDGKLTEEEYERLKRSIETSKIELANELNNEQESYNESSDNYAWELLKNALTTIRTTNSETKERLYDSRNALTAISEKNFGSKKDLNLARKEAIAIIEQALSDLNNASSSVKEATTEIRTADEPKSANERLTVKLTNSLESAANLLEESKQKIRDSKNSEELKSVINIAATNLEKTRATVTSESESIAIGINKIRRDLVLAKITKEFKQQSERNTPPEPEVLTQLKQLRDDKLITENEFSELNQQLIKQNEAESENSSPESFAQNQPKESPETQTQTLVQENDIVLTESLITNSSENNNKPFSIDSIEKSKPKETGGFLWADLNSDNWISPSEVLHFIDLLFEGEPVRSVQDIQNLIDYYFDQE